MKNRKIHLFDLLETNRTIRYCVIALILGVTFFVHCFKLGSLPYGVHFDEIGMGYDAWSLANFGVDRHLNSFPAYLINYGGGQSSLYCYMAAFIIKLFGLSIITIRMPAVIFSFIFLIYGFKIINMRYHSFKYNFIFLLLYTILPYFIMQSRIGLDCNLMLSVSTVFLYYYIKSIETQSYKYFFISGMIAGVTLYTYVLSYLALPLFLLLSFCYFIHIKRISCKQILIFGFPLGILAIPLILVQLINIFDLPQMVIGGITLVHLPEYRAAELTLSNVLSNAFYTLKSILFYDWIPYNTSTKYLTMYWLSIPFICIGFYNIIVISVQQATKRVFSIDFLLTIWFVSLFLIGCVLGGTGPNTNKLNGIFFALLYFLISGIFYVFTKTYKWKLPIAYITFILYFTCFISFSYSYFSQPDTLLWFFDHESSGAVKYLETSIKENDTSKDIYIQTSELYFLASTLTSPYDYKEFATHDGYEDYKFYLPENPEILSLDSIYLVQKENRIYLQRLLDLGFSYIEIDSFYICTNEN